MEEGLWYVRQGDSVTGPLTGLDVRAGIASRRLPGDVEVSKDRLTWRPASAVPSLVPPLPAPTVAGLPGTGAASRFGPPPQPTWVRRGPPRAEPMDGLPHPDAWSALWGTILAVVSLVAWILPISTGLLGPLGGRGEFGEDRWLFPWSHDFAPGESFTLQLVQPGAAVAALFILRLAARRESGHGPARRDRRHHARQPVLRGGTRRPRRVHGARGGRRARWAASSPSPCWREVSGWPWATTCASAPRRRGPAAPSAPWAVRSSSSRSSSRWGAGRSSWASSSSGRGASGGPSCSSSC